MLKAIAFFDPSGGNEVIGPDSSTDSAIALWDGDTGKLLKNSSVIVTSGSNTLIDIFPEDFNSFTEVIFQTNPDGSGSTAFFDMGNYGAHDFCLIMADGITNFSIIGAVVAPIATFFGSTNQTYFNRPDLGTLPDASALLQADSTTQGVAWPRMTTTQVNAITSPLEGLQLYDTTVHQPAYFNGTSWKYPPVAITRSINSVSTDTAAGSATATDYVYLVTGAHTITLPTAVGNTNLYTIKRVSSGTTTVATTAGQTIDGASTQTLLSQYESMSFISDNANWGIV